MKKLLLSLLLATLTVGAAWAENPTFTLLTNADDLKAGDQIVLLGYGYNKNGQVLSLMGAINSSNVAACVNIECTSTIQANGALEIPSSIVPAEYEGTSIITIGGSKNKWTLSPDDGENFLRSSSSDKNQIQSSSFASDYSEATITVDENTNHAHIVFGNGYMNSGKSCTHLSYNYNNSVSNGSYSDKDRFSCYTADQNSGFMYIYYYSPASDVTLTIGDTGYATMYYGDRNLTVPEGIAGWTFSANDKGLTATKSYDAGSVIPAGEGVVLFTVAPGQYTFAVADAATAGNPVVGNMLKGTDADENVTPAGTAYVLGIHEGEVAFYKREGAFKNGAHKAYLEIPRSSSGAPARFDLNFGDVTGISIIAVDENVEDGSIYNALGQKVDNNYKGLVIKNGKKYINK